MLKQQSYIPSSSNNQGKSNLSLGSLEANSELKESEQIPQDILKISTFHYFASSIISTPEGAHSIWSQNVLYRKGIVLQWNANLKILLNGRSWSAFYMGVINSTAHFVLRHVSVLHHFEMAFSYTDPKGVIAVELIETPPGAVVAVW